MLSNSWGATGNTIALFQLAHGSCSAAADSLTSLVVRSLPLPTFDVFNEKSRQWEQARDILEFMRNPTSAGSSRFEGLALPISASEYELDTAPSSFNTDRDSLRDEPISRRPSPGGGSRRSSGGWGKGNDWPPRPDAVSFHVVVKALVAADEWEDAVYVLEEMREER